MKNFEALETWEKKKLRTLRNNLNNRLQSFKNNPDHPKSLQTSHMLYGLGMEDCQKLLKKVQLILRDLK